MYFHVPMTCTALMKPGSSVSGFQISQHPSFVLRRIICCESHQDITAIQLNSSFTSPNKGSVGEEVGSYKFVERFGMTLKVKKRRRCFVSRMTPATLWGGCECAFLIWLLSSALSRDVKLFWEEPLRALKGSLFVIHLDNENDLFECISSLQGSKVSEAVRLLSLQLEERRMDNSSLLWHTKKSR